MALNFDYIDGTSGYYSRKNAELIVHCDSDRSAQELEERLTLTNLAVKAELRALKKKPTFSPQHTIRVQHMIKDLESKQELKCFTKTDERTYSIPPGFHFLVKDITDNGHMSKEIINPVFEGYERYYQSDAVKKLLQYKRASLHLATGTGKTVVLKDLCNTFTAMKKRVAVVVPSVELLKQTFKTVAKDAKFTTTMLGGGTRYAEGKDVVVTTAQSAAGVIDSFQVVVFDEGHRVGCDTWQELCVASLGAQYVYSMTGSPERNDGMSDLIWAFCGPIVYSYGYEKGLRDGFLSPIKYLPVNVPIHKTLSKSLHRSKEYHILHSHPDYINKAVTYTTQALEKKRRVLVLFKQVDTARVFADNLNMRTGKNFMVAHGEFRAPLYMFKNHETDVLIGTPSLLAEGLDIPDISAIIYCAGGASEVTWIQTIGRGIRKAPGKEDCVIVDLIVSNHYSWKSAGDKRKYIASLYKDTRDKESVS